MYPIQTGAVYVLYYQYTNLKPTFFAIEAEGKP